MSKRIKLLFLALATGSLGCAALLPGCSSGGVSSNSAAGGAGGTSRGQGGSGGANAAGHAGDGTGGTSDCDGNAPACRGVDLQQCCGQDPYGSAICQNGHWMCFLGDFPGVPAPGCNGRFDCGRTNGGEGGQAGAGGQAGEGGAGQAGDGAGGAVECAGQAPNCFGADLQTCCGQDPAGPATCENGQWLCFGVAAPGCNGQSCI